MKKTLLIAALLLSITTFAQTTIANLYRGSASALIIDKRLAAELNLYIPKGAAPTLNGGPDSTGAFFYNTSDKFPYIYQGNGTWARLSLSTGNKTVKDTTVTFTGKTTSVTITSGITYNPSTIDVSITSFSSSSGDNGGGFAKDFDNNTHILRLTYPIAPIGTFTYHIVFTNLN